uniref:Oxidoreductase NAD-binding domain containing 1 n=1 Tax=Oncorhynchus tshawytscha TaxID=74940 RepID=A0AAZ3Q5S1_ONCTS
MSVLCILSMAARSFTLSGASGGLIRSRVLFPCSITRKMSSRRQMDHLERTASNYRQDRVYPARVCSIMDESETVKRLRLAVHPDFTFRAGQWVDFFIPGMEKVGGFSVCSSPGLLLLSWLSNAQNIPPAHWIHTKCTMDSHVAMRVGGNFFFDPLPFDPCVDLLLGGGATTGSTHLCYSAKNAQELLFKVRGARGMWSLNIFAV